MGKKPMGKNRSLIIRVVTLIEFLTTFALMVTTVWSGLAWFSSQRSVKTSLTSLIAANTDFFDHVDAYPCVQTSKDTSTDAITEYYFSKTAYTEEETRDFGYYALVSTNYNAILLDITFNASVTANSTLDFIASTTTEEWIGHQADALDYTDNPLSSIIAFYVFPYSALVDGSSTIANSNKIQFATISGSTVNRQYLAGEAPSFAVASGSAYTFAQKREIASDVNVETNFHDTANSSYHCYVIIDYSVALIDAVYSANISNDKIFEIDHLLEVDGYYYITWAADFTISFQNGNLNNAAASSAPASSAILPNSHKWRPEE